MENLEVKTCKRIIALFLVVVCCSTFSLCLSAMGVGDNKNIELLSEPVLKPAVLEAMSNYRSTENVYTSEPTNVYTTIGREVDAFIKNEPFDMGWIAQVRTAWLQDSGLTEVEYYDGAPTIKYNCHSYAWYDRSRSNCYWIDSPHEFTLDLHREEISEEQLQEGDIVVYKYGSTYVHSAVVYSISADGEDIECVSKFGRYGLFKHDKDHAAEYYTYDESDTKYYRYVQGEHQNTHTTRSSIQHHVDCEVDGCSYNEYHDTIITSVNSNRHRLSCAECDYSVYEDHDLYLHTAEPGDYVVKCRDCSYTIECSEDPEFIDGDETGHWVDCTCGCYSFFEEHSYNYHWLLLSDPKRLFYHRATCSVCTGTRNFVHNWVRVSGGYECSDCGMPTSIIPNYSSLSDEELSLLLSSMSEEEIEQFIALLPEDALARVTAILPPVNDDELLTE